jgi:DNA topoisomerase-1
MSETLLEQETPAQSARAVGLRYVHDDGPGIRRVRRGRNFSYIDIDGKALRDRETLGRIKALVIPPAWNQVWICPIENGHIQVTARDAKGRKQYRYHPRWRTVRDETKYERMIAFGKALPLIREKVKADLALPGMPREKVLGAIVRLLETTFMRVGNAEYARSNHSFGLTTLRDKHVDVDGARLRFHFRGKSGKQHNIQLEDKQLARIVKRCRDLPGQELFQYIAEDGVTRSIGSADVNEYLQSITGEDYTAKDFRTWAGTVLAALALQELSRFESPTQAKRNLLQAVEHVAERLGNTPTICRKCYIHPAVIDSYLEGSMRTTLKRRAENALSEDLRALRPQEAAVLGLLQQRLQRAAA